MAARVFKFIEHKTMKVRFSLAFLLVILLPMVALACFSYLVIDSVLMEKAHEKLDMGLKAALTEYYTRGDQMRYGMLQAASTDSMKRAVSARDRQFLRDMLIRWKQARPYVDIWTVVDSGGVVLARLNSEASGDRLEMEGLLEMVFTAGEPTVSTEFFSRDMLRKDGGRVLEMAALPGALPGRMPVGPEGDEAGFGAMALTVVTPVFGETGEPAGAIITADVINNDSFVPDQVAQKIPGLFTTISMKGVRVSTNLMDDSGKSIKGTRIPEGVSAPVSAGEYSEWSIPGEVILSSFAPLMDHAGRTVGLIDVGISKDSLWMIQSKNQQVIALVTIAGISFSLFIALFSAGRITRPLTELKDKIRAFAEGDTEARVEVSSPPGSKDEIGILARTFNSMMDEVSRREEEKKRYLAEIERKNRGLAALNEELRTKSEEIEVAYEETQSQTEELHAINEELKLLNEDLDRKNAELRRANRTITLEEEEELKKTRDKLHHIYDSITDYMVVVDYDHNVREANRHFLEDFGVTEEEAVGRKFYSFFGRDCSYEPCPTHEAIDGMKPVEVEIEVPDGRSFLVHAYPLVGGEGSGKQAVLYIKDVTEQRLLQQKLIHADKLSSLGELVSGVAHELNNPLTGIMCFSELLIEDIESEEVRTKLEKIRDASIRCKKIIDNLLTFARVQRPEKGYEDINKIIEECIELRGYQLNVENIEVETALDRSIPKTMLDGNQVMQVFINLFNNARDAIADSGSGGRILITSRLAGQRIVVEFEDDGPGIPPDVASRVFDPFFTTKEVGRGTGLGLSISYGIIKEHGGEISVSPRDGGGTVFTMEIPVVAEPASDSALSGAHLSAEDLKSLAAGRRALVLDDEPIVLEILDGSLSASGMLVDRAKDVRDAIEKLKKHEYDVIISDIRMPGLDGRDFYNEIRGVSPGHIGRIIFITGDGISPDTRSFLEETGVASMHKPFTVDELRERILRLLGGDEVGGGA